MESEEQLLSALLRLEMHATIWFELDSEERQPEYLAFVGQLNALLALIPQHRIETRNIAEAFSYHALWECPQLLTLTLYPLFCYGLHPLMKLRPLYERVYLPRTANPAPHPMRASRPNLRLIRGGKP